MFRHDLASYSAYMMQTRIPQLKHRLPSEPTQAYQQAVYDACLVVFSAGFSGGHEDLFRDDGAVGFGDFPFFQLAGDDLFDLVLEAEGNAGDVRGGHCGFNAIIRVRRKHWARKSAGASAIGRIERDYVAGTPRGWGGFGRLRRRASSSAPCLRVGSMDVVRLGTRSNCYGRSVRSS